MLSTITAEKVIAIQNNSAKGSSRLTEYHTPTCADCVHFRVYHLKQSNGAYRSVGSVGACARSGHNLDSIQSMIFAESHRPSCEHFEPIEGEAFQRIWLRTPKQ